MTYPITVAANIDLTVLHATTQSAPTTFEMTVYGNTLLEVLVHSINTAGVAGTNLYFRIRNNGVPIVPVSGWLRVPGGVLDIKFEHVLEGPPFKITLETYNSHATNDTLIHLVVTVGDKHEVDNDVRTLNELSRIRKLLED